MKQTVNQNLLKSASDGDLQAVKAALEKGADITTHDEYNNTALNVSASNGNLELIKFLVEKGSDINNLGGAAMSPLMQAATAGHVDASQFLIDQGALVTNDLIGAMNLKVSILKENAEIGMVKPEAVAAWEAFTSYLLMYKEIQNQKK